MTTKYTDDHEWVRRQDDLFVIGITDYAQEQLGEIVYVELPDIGRTVNQGEEIAVIESVKAAGDVKSPIGGTVIEVNDLLEDNPETINESPLQNGWIMKVKCPNSGDFDSLMDDNAYQAFVDSL